MHPRRYRKTISTHIHNLIILPYPHMLVEFF
uniref:Uncharacterized protein n=1 Tax=Anguilla anguilla TaxID=7936 RepID=A0A0E9WWW1_ANGAN